MGLGDRLKSAFNPNEKDKLQMALEAAGLTMVAFERMGDRIKTLEQFKNELKREPDDPNCGASERFEFYVKQWHKIWDMYKTNQIAWLRPGSNHAFARMAHAIDGMNKETEVAIINNREILNRYSITIQKAKELKDTITENQLKLQQQQLVTDFYISYLVQLMYYYVEKQADLCWLTEDVSTPATIAIQSNQPLQPGRINMAGTGIPPNQQDTTTSSKRHDKV